MSHPIMFDESDPYLAQVRRICHELPGVTEAVSHGRPVFRAGKIFCVYGGGTKGGADVREDYARSVIVLPEPEELLALQQDAHHFTPAYYGPYGWIGWNLYASASTPDTVDWQEVAELVEGSFRQLAPKKLLAQLDR